MEQMKAAYYETFGEPEILKVGFVDIPGIKEDEVLIKIAATSYNAMDGMMLRGFLGPVEFPHIPHLDFSGVIVEAGDQVKGFEVSDHVFGALMPDLFRNGSATEYIAVNPEEVILAHAPKAINLQDAGVLVGACLTAYQGLVEHLQVKKGQRVYICGGAGGVGHYAVQIAKRLGAYVIASASKKNLEFLKELGADEVFDYKSENLGLYAGAGVDAVFSIAPISTEEVTGLLCHIKSGGRLVSTLNPADPQEAEKYNVEASAMAVHPSAADLSAIVEMIEEKTLKPYIDKRYALDDIADCYFAAGTNRGKLAIVVNESL